MRLALNPRARRLLRRVPRTTAYTVLELILLSLLAIQCARLFWALVTPVGPIGDWKSSALRAVAPVSTTLLGSFDPFFRLAGGGPATVTSLDLKLFGISENRASGRGSAIIALPDGQQRSFAVGDEIMPGVKLAAVAFDSVTVDRGGTMEQLFLDQSPPARMVDPDDAGEDVAPAGLEPIVAPPPPPLPQTSPTLGNQVQYQPRMRDGRVIGVTVNPQGGGEAFRASGLQPNDVILSVNGQQISSTDQAQAIASQINGNSDVTAVVERNGQPTTVHVRTRP